LQKLLKYSKSKELIGMIAAAVLTAAGILIIAMAANSFDDEIEKSQDAQLENMAVSSDLSLTGSISHFDEQMGRFVGSERFQTGIASRGEASGAAQLKQLMQNSFVSNSTYFSAMLLVDNGEVQASTMEGKSYSIGKKLRDNIYSCTDSSGNGYLALKYDIDDRLSCFGIIGIKGLYYGAVQQTNAPPDSLLLLEAETGTFYGQKDGAIIRTDNPEEINGREGQNLLDAQEETDASVLTYDKNVGKEKRTMRVLAVPTDGLENGIFAISAASDYDVIEALARSTTTKLILGFVLVLAGLVIALFIFLRGRREVIQADMELEDLKEKNRQMEELNQKTQELAHHQRLETIGTLTSSIAHEFNNLLTPIMGYSLMTLEKLPQDDEGPYDDVLEIYNASVKAKDIISRLSELSRKNTEMRFETINPDDLVNKVLHVTSPALPKKVDIFRNLNCSRKYIEGNETQLSQLILNLIINAFHALGEEGGEVTVTTEKVGSDIMIEVADNGPGIPDDIKEKIFDPFFTTKEAGVGTGLGLAIALQAAEDHKGRLEVESEEGKGASFKVFIPELVVQPERVMKYYEE